MSSPTITPDSSHAPVVRRVAAVGFAGLALVLTLAACSGGSSGGGTTSAPSSSAAATGSSPAAGGGAGAGRPGPAASGLVASVAGTTMQVQSQQTGQVAVAWTGSTSFTHAVTESVAALKAGDCVVAVAPSGTAAGATSFTASAVQVASSTGGTCTTGFGGGGGAGGQRPSGAPGGAGGQRPSGAPGGAGAGRAGGGSIASGKVTSVSGSTVVIAAQQRTPGSTTAATTSVTVTIGSSSKITKQASTTSSSVQVGKCVTAQGTPDSTGTVTATSVQITDAANGQCATGFGGGIRG
jgi:hypothetical protein